MPSESVVPSADPRGGASHRTRDEPPVSAPPTPYDDDFFADTHAEAHSSARGVVPRVLGLTGARSVVDVGSGTGAWARACRDLGVPEVVCVDGAHVPAAYREHGTTFVERDLAEPLDLGQSFELAICVEVAEHVSPDRAPGLVADLTALAPVVLFSAAIPGQGGTGHVNEQWSEYWVALWDAEGWTCRDAIRPWVRTNEDVAWWYRQNLYLAVGPRVAQAYTSFPQLGATRPEHPVDFIVRPYGDVIVPPAPLPPEPDPEPVVEPQEPPPTPVAEPLETDDAPPHPPGLGLDPATDTPGEPDDGPAATASDDDARRADGPYDDDLVFPQPPGWATLRRVAGRVRRRPTP